MLSLCLQVSGNERRGARNAHAKAHRDSAIFRVLLPSLPVAGEHYFEFVVIDAWATNSVFFHDSRARGSNFPNFQDSAVMQDLGYLQVVVTVEIPADDRNEL